MNLKKYQGRIVIFIIGIFGFSLLGANPLSSVLIAMSVLIVSPILFWLNKFYIAFNPDTRKFVLVRVK